MICRISLRPCRRPWHLPSSPPHPQFPFFSPFLEGMVFGASFWSVYADKRGRKSAFVWSLALVFIAGVLSAASPSLAVLCLCRVVVGFGAGGKMTRHTRSARARETPPDPFRSGTRAEVRVYLFVLALGLVSHGLRLRVRVGLLAPVDKHQLFVSLLRPDAFSWAGGPVTPLFAL